MRYRSPTRLRQSTRSRYGWGSVPVNCLFGRGQLVASLGWQGRERGMHVIFCRVRDDQRVSPAVGFQCLSRLGGLGRGWSRNDRDLHNGGGGGGPRWPGRLVGPPDGPGVKALAFRDDDLRRGLRGIRVLRVGPTGMGRRMLLLLSTF